MHGSRYSNISKVDKYIKCVNQNKSIIITKEDMDKMDLMKEYVMLTLRKIEGLSYNDFKAKFKVDINDIFLKEITKLKDEKLLKENGSKTHLKLTKRGLEVANLVWQEFV